MNTISMTPERRAAALERQRALEASYGRIVNRATDEERKKICDSSVEHYLKRGMGDEFTPQLGIEARPRPKPAPAGKYRIIHGRIGLGAKTRPDGSTYYEFGCLGDEVYLTTEDATRMLSDGVIEELDASPSRVGRVWTPPKPVRNYRADHVYGVVPKGGAKR